MSGIGDFLEGFSVLFGALAFLNRALKNETGKDLGDYISSVGESVKKIPPKAMIVKDTGNVKDRVEVIKQMIIKYREHPQIRAIASDILNKRCGDKWCIPEKDWLAEVKAVFDAVRKNVRYTRDPISKDLFVSPIRTLTQYHLGDCDDLTIVLGSILGHIGYPLKLRVIQTVGNSDYNHIYLMVGIPPFGEPKKWIAADASVTNKPLGYQAPSEVIIRKRDFPIEPLGYTIRRQSGRHGRIY
ncbi:transglutaminase domain-containing protein [Candidatus Bathyarchaeota archaeon]|nr:transglutaminase domain-containing protein [Candidatus Bathyarchaeota archaeon]